MQLFLKILSGIANNVDPNQTAPTGSALFEYAILSETLVFEILGQSALFEYAILSEMLVFKI